MHAQALEPQPRILVVDDHVDTVDSTAILLEMLGASVHRAYGGAMAIELGRTTNPDLVLLDLLMPGVDGYEVAGELQRLPGSTPMLVAVSGRDHPADKLRCAEAGFDLHLTKPVGFDVLTELVQARSNYRSLAQRVQTLEQRHSAALRELISARVDMATTLLQVARTTTDAATKERCLQKAQQARQQIANQLLRPPWSAESVSPVQFVAERVLTGALTVLGASMGTVQLLEGGTLYLRAQRGFGSKFLQHFEAVDKHDTYAWGTALRDKILTAINDVQADARFAEHRNAAALGNFRAALSAPLISPRGQPLGVVSVYFPHPTRFSASDLEAFQRHAERSAAAIDWALV